MTLISRRRLSRLEKRVASVVADRKRRECELVAWVDEVVFYHATKLATLILHGDPKIDEPLAIAWERALDYLGLSGTHLVLSETSHELLYYRLRAALEDVPGDTEIDKLAHIFRSAPSWLLDFCMARVDCWRLGIEILGAQNPHRNLAGRGVARLGMRGRISLRVRLAQVVLLPNPIPCARSAQKKRLTCTAYLKAVKKIGCDVTATGIAKSWPRSIGQTPSQIDSRWLVLP